MMLYFILYTYYKVKILWGETQQYKKAGGAFCKVYKNDDIFKDLIKLLYASGHSQQDMA